MRSRLPSRQSSPFTSTAAILAALLVALLSAVVITLNRQEAHSYRAQVVAQLATSARVAASNVDGLQTASRARAAELASSPRVQEAAAVGDLTRLQRIARAEAARIEVGGRSVSALPTGARFLAFAEVAGAAARTRVTTAVSLDEATIRIVQAHTGRPRAARLMFIRGGRIVAGGPVAERAIVRDGRLALGDRAYYAAAAPLAQPGMQVIAIEPETVVSSSIARFRNRTLIAAALTLLLICALSMTLARPLRRVVGELSERATHDPLTQLANRRLLEERLSEELDRARRRETHLALVLIDVDNFKQLNDRYGHPFGDDVLRAVAAALADSIRELDLAGRFGGEEFALLLPGTSTTGACRVAEQARLAISDIALESPTGDIVHVTASFGAADFPTCRTSDELVGLADHYVYQAKRDGKNRVAAGVLMPTVT
jgi:diguanylate cyclase (GGDEF)-like protein